MKKCNSQLMKELKELQSLINFAQDREQRICTIAYSNREPNAMGNEYDYDFTRKELADLQKEELRI